MYPLRTFKFLYNTGHLRVILAQRHLDKSVVGYNPPDSGLFAMFLYLSVVNQILNKAQPNWFIPTKDA